MSRGASTFKQTDLTRAIKAAVKAGLKDWRVEIDRDGKIIVIAAAPAKTPDDQETSADIRRLL
jgi:hypothetical protein